MNIEKAKYLFTIIFTSSITLTGILCLFMLPLGVGYKSDGSLKYATDEMKYAIRLILPFSTSISTLMIGYFFGKKAGKLEILEKKEEENKEL